MRTTSNVKSEGPTRGVYPTSDPLGRFRTSWFAALLAMFVLVSACNADDGGVASTTGISATSPTSESEGTPSTAGSESAETAPLDRLVIALPEEPPNLEITRGNFAVYGIVGANIADSLAYFDVNGDGAMHPNLATSWEPVAPDTWRLTLREDVVFSDGRPLTASDVAASLNFGVTDPPTSFYENVMPTVTRAEAVDDHTVDVFTNGVDALFEQRLGFLRIAPADSMTEESLAENLIGSGKYRLVQWDRGQSILLEWNENHWGDGEPMFHEVEFLIRPDEAVRVAAVEAGEAHIATSVSPDVAVRAPQLIQATGIEVAGYMLNTTGQKPGGSIMSDKNVRLAVNHAIDREAIAESIFNGATLPNGQYNPPFYAGIDPDLEDYAYDPEQARALLEQAGVVGSTVTILTMNTWPKAQEMSEVVGGYLTDAGLSVEHMGVEIDQWLDFVAQHEPGEPVPYDIAMIYHGNVMFEPVARTFPNLLLGVEGSSRYLVADSSIDELIREAQEETDTQQRNELSMQIWNILYEEAYMLPIAIPDAFYAASENIVWEPRLTGEILVDEIGWQE